MDTELQNALLSFMGYFELVFDNDWELTKTRLEGPEYYVAEGGTFLNPGVEDEENNWANRARVLESYRALKTLLKQREVIK